MASGILIENGNVIDGTGAPMRTESVLVDGENISATGAEADKQADGRNDIRKIDATGMTVMPGMIDAHCHITFDEPTSNDELFNHRSREGLASTSRSTTWDESGPTACWVWRPVGLGRTSNAVQR